MRSRARRCRSFIRSRSCSRSPKKIRTRSSPPSAQARSRTTNTTASARRSTPTANEVRIYSRTLDNVTHRFPEIEAAAKRIGHSVILDGEIVAFSDRILPFAVIQTRLGRKKISEKLLTEAPVAFFAFDLFCRNGEPLFGDR